MSDDQRNEFREPRPPDREQPAGVVFQPARRAPESLAEEVKRRHEGALLALPGVEGVGLTREDDQEAIVVYLRDEAARGRLPAELEGFELRAVVTGGIRAL